MPFFITLSWQRAAQEGHRQGGPVGEILGGAVGAVTGTVGGILGLEDRPLAVNYFPFTADRLTALRTTERAATARLRAIRFGAVARSGAALFDAARFGAGWALVRDDLFRTIVEWCRPSAGMAATTGLCFTSATEV